ncbi:protein phosphatase 1F-like isoform X1 [Leptonychotes weddellii]|uniref:Protein phosphatase 1F-like isoform X1 n=1 Tax=Leptonychotes weddellii TaxID=9713 RepID=A0A7F8PXD0_LEPWE|nr:protein phosphatase 1F-like isoform X1 [Leptonychotes weddellii]
MEDSVLDPRGVTAQQSLDRSGGAQNGMPQGKAQEHREQRPPRIPAETSRDALGMASRAPQQSSQLAEEIPGFLDAFLCDFPAPLSLESPVPWKLPGTVLSQEEVEGELAELVMGFLSSRSAPPPLASSLAHEAVSRLLQTDLSEFRKLPGQEEEEEEEDDDKEEKAPVTCEFSSLSGLEA